MEVGVVECVKLWRVRVKNEVGGGKVGRPKRWVGRTFQIQIQIQNYGRRTGDLDR